MPTNLAIEDNLIIEAQKLGKHRTKKDTVNEALKEYIQRRKQLEIIRMFGKIDYDKNYNYKSGRTRKRVKASKSER
ncbi:MAG TPA: type II toxin-antitoxin system VapB family antitoxin [Spirochaetales bacterium]|nr:type II toxin-antitoxin system VapB family antitoxin [Spirochaetales bacterium]